MNILGVDIGGTNLKFRMQQQDEIIKVPSGPSMTPQVMMKAIQQHTAGWKYDHVSIGFPGPVIHDRPLLEPHNLGHGWVRFDFKKAFGNKPLKFLNDAAMQAMGSYKGGRMLYLGLAPASALRWSWMAQYRQWSLRICLGRSRNPTKTISARQV
jgi:polyphosphate glucokinase